MAYLTVAEFKDRTVAPQEYVDEVETRQAGWTLKQLELWSKWIDARLAKRYAVPFVAPLPECVLNWLTRIVTWELYLKRGIDPTDAQNEQIKERADGALDEVKEAADNDKGLFELPIRVMSGKDDEGVTRGSPLAHTEAGPYKWSRAQRSQAYIDGY
jgi:Protein of unknown function (DUF1320)